MAPAPSGAGAAGTPNPAAEGRRRSNASGVATTNGGGIIGSSFLPGGNFRRILLAATATPFVTHGDDLPPPLRHLISPRARIILNFCVEYLNDRKAKHGWDVDLYVTGGYVRDLLLGRISPDLDLSLGLTRYPPDVTVSTVADGMDEFCRSRPDLAVESVEVITRKSGAAERKDVDAAQVCLTIGGGEDIYLDLLPTIGAEVYDPRGPPNLHR